MKKFAFLFVGIILFQSCKQVDQEYAKKLDNPEFLHMSMKNLSNVIVYDIFSPPVASRIYAYPSIAAYEIMAIANADNKSLAGQLTGLTKIPTPEKEIHHGIAAVHAFNLIGKELTFSEDKMEAFQAELDEQINAIDSPKNLVADSKKYGQLVANHILDWADKDNYKQTRSFPKFTVDNKTDTWKPTPPAYMEGIEPHWNAIRPMVIKSADQFTPEPPTKFDISKGSEFFGEIMEVYDAVNEAEKEEKEIASFWDCNPYVMNQKGHAMFATKKITPGGHWMGICRIACTKDGSDLKKSTKVYALTSIALMDGFISCWDEKYRSKLIRPETLINEHVDPDWLPLLQTPPFPEYTSGHSVISSAAAVALTSIFGDNFSYDDDVEVEYGLPVRSFTSFIQASEEAAISRLYGGIHYRPAIDNGVKQGRALGNYIVQEISL